MPSGKSKKEKRNEKSTRAGMLPSTDGTSAEQPCASGVETSTSGDRGSESRDGSTGTRMEDIDISGTEPMVGEVQRDEEKKTKKKKKKKKKKKASHDNDENNIPSNDEAIATSREEEGSVGEECEINENNKLDTSCEEHDEVFASDFCDKIAVNDEASCAGDKVEPYEQQDVLEERNFAQLARLLIEVGAHVLRQYFFGIHPTWSNQPSDASALRKGVFKLLKHEQTKFYTGNIDEWDVSLLIRVLRFTEVSSVELKCNPDIKTALENILEIRNNVIAHAKNKKISDSDFKINWEKLKQNLLVIGGSEEMIDATLTDYTELGLEQYKVLFLEEISLRKFSEQGSEKTNESGSSVEEIELQESHPGPQWDAWLKICDLMDSFKSSQTQFVLLAGVMAQADVENFKVLAAIPWSMVIDFNPSSEDDGLYKAFSSQTNLQRLLSAFTPGQISKLGCIALPKQIDSKRTQWLFANGRKEDAEDSKPKSFPAWKTQLARSITTFFTCCADGDTFDNQKSVKCLVLSISEADLPFVEETLNRFIESFLYYDLSLAGIDESCKKFSLSKQVHTFQLSSVELKNGMENLFDVTEDVQKYEMPCFQSGIRHPFLQKEYIYISEYLELFYVGCENKFINPNDEEEVQNVNEEEHRKGFLSGNLISFLSLFFNHDAKRVIERDIEIHIQRMLNQTLKQSGIVQIAHPPGTGGSTIARRVLWNLHESFPCASVQLSSQTEFDEDSNFINELCTRISILEDQCLIPPVILIDGHRQWRIHALSNRIVRTLNSRGKRAVILECHRGSKPHANADVHKVFHVDALLENSSADLREFKEKFQESDQSARRVFHFPLLSMIKEFRDKLETIVTDTLNELQDLEKDIAAFVAFLQLYAEQPTPALLLYEVFQSRLSISQGVQVTYQSIKECFSGSLLNLMVHQKRQKTKDDCLTHYTLQHHVVATLVFKKYLEKKKKTLYKYVYEFLQCNVPNIKKYVALYCDLFLFNRGGNRKLRFSVLIDELSKCNTRHAATIVRTAAELIPDPRAYGHAARFYAKMNPPKFKEAEDLIAAGIKLSESHGRVKSIQDSKGVVHSLELKHKIRSGKINGIEDLQEMAKKALTAFHAARDFPPTFPSPLIGEVEVWILCIEWIIKAHSDDADEGVKFIVNKAPPFFRTCIGDSFYLLELVDRMVLSVTMIADPDDIRDRAHKFRLTLMTTVRPGIVDNGRRRNISHSLLGIDSSLTLPQISAKESKRIRTRMLLTLYWREHQTFKPDDMKELMKLLEDMVFVEKDYSFASHFLQLCLLGNGQRMCNLERGWKVCRNWLEVPDCLDPMRYYYSMVIAFVQILNGLGPQGYFAEYKSLVEKLNDSSRNHCRRNQSLHFLKKNGSGMSQLISHQSLLDASSYNAENPDVVKSFWTVGSRRKLKECTGRVRVKVVQTKKVTTIELLEGEIELYVGKYAEIGIPGKDFDKDAKVYFVVSFNLRGPVANGITFHPTVQASSPM